MLAFIVMQPRGQKIPSEAKYKNEDHGKPNPIGPVGYGIADRGR